jgi:C4-dicarboxylate-specific signal transduction histidine kinase
MKPVGLRPLVERVAMLETRLAVAICGGPEIVLMVDSDQIEQMLINLVRNAVEAALETNETASPKTTDAPAAEVSVRWTVEGQSVVLMIDDNGPGLLNPSNAFVPFYTTKPSGSGIGLALSRGAWRLH